MSRPALPPECNDLIRALSRMNAVMDALHDTALSVLSDLQHPDAVRMHTMEAFRHLHAARRILDLQGDKA